MGKSALQKNRRLPLLRMVENNFKPRGGGASCTRLQMMKTPTPGFQGAKKGSVIYFPSLIWQKGVFDPGEVSPLRLQIQFSPGSRLGWGFPPTFTPPGFGFLLRVFRGLGFFPHFTWKTFGSPGWGPRGVVFFFLLQKKLTQIHKREKFFSQDPLPKTPSVKTLSCPPGLKKGPHGETPKGGKKIWDTGAQKRALRTLLKGRKDHVVWG